MSTTTNAANGRATRKSLSEQIDRLDRILDGLADALEQAVAQAVQAAVEVAVREAVRSVLTEILTNADVLAKLRAQIAPPIPVAAAMPAPETELRASRLWTWIVERVRAVCRSCTAALARLRGGMTTARQKLDVARPYAKPLLIATGVGVLVGVLAYLAGPSLAALASGIGGFATALAAQAGLWVRRNLGALPRWDA